MCRRLCSNLQSVWQAIVVLFNISIVQGKTLPYLKCPLAHSNAPFHWTLLLHVHSTQTFLLIALESIQERGLVAACICFTINVCQNKLYMTNYVIECKLIFNCLHVNIQLNFTQGFKAANCLSISHHRICMTPMHIKVFWTYDT